jgi:hypothetical protein
MQIPSEPVRFVTTHLLEIKMLEQPASNRTQISCSNFEESINLSAFRWFHLNAD